MPAKRQRVRCVDRPHDSSYSCSGLLNGVNARAGRREIELLDIEAVWAGRVASAVIAPEGEEWDGAVLVEYPSAAAFIEMMSSPDYRAASPHRTAALLDSRLIATHSSMSQLSD